MYVQYPHNSLVSDSNECGKNNARDEDKIIIISDFILRSMLTPQLKQMSERYKVTCGCECYISAKIIHSLLLSWINRY